MFYPDWVLILGIVLIAVWLVTIIHRNLSANDKPKAYKYILVIVKNQESTIEDILRRTLRLQKKYMPYAHLIFVDLASTDKTSEIILRMAYSNNYLTLLRIDNHEKLENLLSSFGQEGIIVNYTILSRKNNPGP